MDLIAGFETAESLDIPDGAAEGLPFDIPEDELDRRPQFYVQQLRRHMPVWCRRLGRAGMQIRVYTIFPHALARSVFKDARTRQFETEILRARGITEGPLFDLFANGVLASNGEAHRRRRQPLARAFAYPVMLRMQPEIGRVVRDLLARQIASGQLNIRDDFAKILPATLLCHIMGIPLEDIDQFVDWISRSTLGLSAFPSEMLPSIEEATGALLDYVNELLARRREQPGDDFLSHYLAVVNARGDYSAEETYVQIAGTILAGAETARVSITAAISLLLEHDEAWQAVKREPSLASAAVNESMRLEPAVGSVPRLVVEDLEICGITVPAGSIISASLIGALRDPEVFENPNSYDIHRAGWPKHHIVFGGGEHRCLGEALGWLEVLESVKAMADLIPHAKLIEGPARVTGFSGIRRISACPIEL